MAYKSEYYGRAISLISDNKKRRQKEYELKLHELYSAVPELQEIDNSLSATGAKAMMAALNGKTQEVKACEAKSKELQARKSEILKSAKIKVPSPSCKKCNDTGYCGTCLCECAKLLAKELVFADLSEQMPIGHQTFSNFDLDYYEGDAKKQMTAVYKFTKKYADGFSSNSKNLLFSGGVGLGKTHLSMAIINTVTNLGYSVVYGSAQNLFTQLEKEHFSYSGESDKIDAILGCDLLVIDDLGSEFSNSFTVSQLYNIVNTRINNGKPTIINTNLTAAEIEKSYTPRVLSRIVGNYKVLKFAGTDIRKKKSLN